MYFLYTIIRAFLIIFLISVRLTNCSAQTENYDFTFNDSNFYKISISGEGNYSVTIDKSLVFMKEYALLIQSDTSNSSQNYKSASFKIDKKFNSNNITLKGSIKTDKISDGFAALWLRLDGKDGVLQFDNMEHYALKNTNDWRDFSISLPYDKERTNEIRLGGLLVGNGKAWFHNLNIFLDSITIQNAKTYTPIIKKADADVEFSVGSKIKKIRTSVMTTNLLSCLGIVWGILKYNCKDIAIGNLNWDAELFRIMPRVLEAKSQTSGYETIYRWMTNFKPDNKLILKKKDTYEVKFSVDYDELFNALSVPKKIAQKLREFVKANDNTSNYYVSIDSNIGNPIFNNELSYSGNVYPDAGLRVLCLYRFWNIVRYFYPNVHLTDSDWNLTLKKYLPVFVNAKNKEEYTLACLRLIGNVQDTHANIWGNCKTLDSLKGKSIAPIKADFIEDKLVVTGYYADSRTIRSSINVGDIIDSIDGRAVWSLVDSLLPFTPASNYPTQLRELPSCYGFLLRSNTPDITLAITNSKGIKKNVTLPRVEVRAAATTLLDGSYRPPTEPAFTFSDDSIGYIYPAQLKDNDLEKIRKQAYGTKGLVIDLRCYPSTFMPFAYGAWLKSKSSPFVKFTNTSVNKPGTFVYTQNLSNGEAGTGYQGKVIILVNANTQSQAEFTAMALRTFDRARIIGSTTAGADGNVSSIVLPGGISTMISGIGTLYPDGKETQRVGVKIDKVVKPTINGIRSGRDEVYDEAVKMIKQREWK